MASALYELFVKLSADNKDLKQGLTEAKQQLQSFGETAATVGKTLVTALSFGAVAQGLITAGTTIENSFRQIANTTGAVGKELQSLEGSFRNVFGNSAASADQVSSALSILHQRFDLTGKDLESATVKMLKVARVTGTDVATAVTESGRLFQQWGITIAKQSGELDFLVKVSQRTGVSFLTLTSTLTSSGAQFRQFGFDLEHAAGFIGLLEKNGLPAEKAIASLNLAMKKFAKEGITDPQAALQELVRKLKDAKSQSEFNTLAFTYLGRSGGAVGEALVRVVPQIDEFTKKMKSAGEQGEGVGVSFEKTWKQFKNEATLALEPIGKLTLDAFKGMLDAGKPALDMLKDMGKALGDLDSPTLKFVGAMVAVGVALKGVSSAFSFIAGSAIATGLAKMGTAFLTFGVGSTAAEAALAAFGLTIAVVAGAIGGYEIGKRLYEMSAAFRDVSDSFVGLLQKVPLLGALINKIFGVTDAEKALAEANVYQERKSIMLDAQLRGHGIVVEKGTMTTFEWIQALSKAAGAVDNHGASLKKNATDQQKYRDQLGQTSKAIADAFSQLGLKDLNADLTKTQTAFALLQSVGVLSAGQVAHAQQLLADKTRDLRISMEGTTVSELASRDASTSLDSAVKGAIKTLSENNITLRLAAKAAGDLYDQQVALGEAGKSSATSVAEAYQKWFEAEDRAVKMTILHGKALELQRDDTVDLTGKLFAYQKQWEIINAELATKLPPIALAPVDPFRDWTIDQKKFQSLLGSTFTNVNWKDSSVNLRAAANEAGNFYDQQLKLRDAGQATALDVTNAYKLWYEAELKASGITSEMVAQQRKAAEGMRQLWDQAANSIADGFTNALFAGKGFGAAMIAAVTDIGKAIVKDLVKGALLDLGKSLLGISTQGKGLIDIFKNVGSLLGIGGGSGGGGGLVTGVAGASAGVPSSVWSSLGLGGSAAGSAAGGAGAAGTALSSSLGTIFSGITAGVSVISGIVGGIQQAHANALLAKIEESTRYLKIGLIDGNNSPIALNIGLMKDRVTEIQGYLLSVQQTLLANIKESIGGTKGGGSSGPNFYFYGPVTAAGREAVTAMFTDAFREARAATGGTF